MELTILLALKKVREPDPFCVVKLSLFFGFNPLLSWYHHISELVGERMTQGKKAAAAHWWSHLLGKNDYGFCDYTKLDRLGDKVEKNGNTTTVGGHLIRPSTNG